MAKSILTEPQKSFLRIFAARKDIVNRFYLTGGTCLSEYYLRHRLSEDLDFFSTSEFEATDISNWIGSMRSKLGIASYEYQQSFNRNLFFLSFNSKDVLKVEFTYYPFLQINKPTKKGGICIDSILDIAINKFFTIYQKPRGRDYYDLYLILKKHPHTTLGMRILAQTKFDSTIDLLQLATRFHEVTVHLDDPILLDGGYDKRQVSEFFLQESLNLKKSILK